MVLESIVNPFEAEKKPLELFLFGFLYASVGLLLSVWVFREYAGLVMVFLTVMASLPLFYKTMFYEEKKHNIFKQEFWLLKSHSSAISFFVMIFLGFVAAFVFWYVILPSGLTETIFSVQTNTINNINQQISGNATQLTLFSRIFLNNTKVLVFCILFSFIFGSGAIFILTWNASVIGVAMGNFIKNKIGFYAAATGSATLGNYFQATSLSLLRYMVHGIPEITAYFVAGLAGGILSVSIIKKEFGTSNFEKVILDVSNLLIISISILFLAAVLETYLTPFLLR